MLLPTWTPPNAYTPDARSPTRAPSSLFQEAARLSAPRLVVRQLDVDEQVG